MNPHSNNCYKILSLARLPVPTLLHMVHALIRFRISTSSVITSPSVGVTGFEPATSWSQTRRSSQAEPHPVTTFLLYTIFFVFASVFLFFCFYFLSFDLEAFFVTLCRTHLLLYILQNHLSTLF